jgi:hypothetical protein
MRLSNSHLSEISSLTKKLMPESGKDQYSNSLVVMRKSIFTT